MNNNKSIVSIGELCEVLCIIFIILKTFGVINWSFWWIFSPLLIDLALVVLTTVAPIICYKIKKKWKKRWSEQIKNEV